MSETELHRHHWLRAEVLDAHGKPLLGARRCNCGVEITGGPVGINVEMVRIGQRLDDSMVEALTRIGRVMRRNYEP